MEDTAGSTSPGVVAERDRLLARLPLAPMPDGIGEGPAGEENLPIRTDVEVTAVRRGGNEPSDRLVAVRLRGPGGAEAVRARLLRPLAGRRHLFCPLGDELSRDTESFEKPCLEPHDGPARGLSAEPLLAPDRDAVVVRDAGGWCGPGAGRGDRFVTSYWGVEGDRLVRYLEAVTYEAWYESPAPPSEIRRGEIALSADWPRTITLTETTECLPLDGSAAAENDCRPDERTTEYHYTDGRYAPTREPAATATPADDGAEETEP